MLPFVLLSVLMLVFVVGCCCLLIWFVLPVLGLVVYEVAGVFVVCFGLLWLVGLLLVLLLIGDAVG